MNVISINQAKRSFERSLGCVPWGNGSILRVSQPSKLPEGLMSYVAICCNIAIIFLPFLAVVELFRFIIHHLSFARCILFTILRRNSYQPTAIAPFPHFPIITHHHVWIHHSQSTSSLCHCQRRRQPTNA
jgi:hypothetical protein